MSRGGTNLPSLSELDVPHPQSQIRSLDFARERIGRPVTFQDGLFEGRTIRAELIELQKADLGRKYARKDRRPLDPPPVVQLKLFEVLNIGTAFETHKEFDSYDERGFGLLCHIDLFPVPNQDDPASAARSRPSSSTAPSTSTSPTPTTPTPGYQYPQSHTSASSSSYAQAGSSRSPHLGHHSPAHGQSSGSYSSGGSSGITLPPISSLDAAPPTMFGTMHLPPVQGSDHSRHAVILPPLTRQTAGAGSSTGPSLSPYSYPPPAPPGHVPHIQHQAAPQPTVSTEGKAVAAPSNAPEGIVAYLNGYPIREDSKQTESLVGARFCQASSLEYQGRKVLMFVFADIAVQIEGTFILRYRVFNLFSHVEGVMDIPILAECYGGPFRIYSTKEFPGLRPSTELTKHLSLFGIRLNLRETERKRRRAGRSSDAASPERGGRRGGRRARGRGDESGEESSEED